MTCLMRGQVSVTRNCTKHMPYFISSFAGFVVCPELLENIRNNYKHWTRELEVEEEATAADISESLTEDKS